MTLGIPIKLFLIETQEEPLITHLLGVTVIRIAYKRVDDSIEEVALNAYDYEDYEDEEVHIK